MDFQNINNIHMISTYVQEFGLMAPAIALGLFVIQAVVPVFPYLVMATVGGLLFGFKLGFFLAWLGALLGACAAYGLCRLLGAEWISGKIESRFGYNIKKIDSEMAFWSIIIARVIPVVPTPIINIGAALSGVSFWTFFFSSAIGKLPTAILYTGLGLCLFKIQDVKLTLLIIALILILAITGRYRARRKVYSKSIS